MKRTVLLFFITMSSLLFAPAPTDWQVDGLQGKVKHMHISKEYYCKRSEIAKQQM